MECYQPSKYSKYLSLSVRLISLDGKKTIYMQKIPIKYSVFVLPFVRSLNGFSHFASNKTFVLEKLPTHHLEPSTCCTPAAEATPITPNILNHSAHNLLLRSFDLHFGDRLIFKILGTVKLNMKFFSPWKKVCKIRIPMQSDPIHRIGI